MMKDVRPYFEDNPHLKEKGTKEIGLGGVPAEAYLVIAAKSATGAVGALAVKELYEYIKQEYIVEDNENEEEGPTVHIDSVYVNFADEPVPMEESEKIYEREKGDISADNAENAENEGSEKDKE